MNASAFFTPGQNGEPPMFGTKESGAFAWEFTPKIRGKAIEIYEGCICWQWPGQDYRAQLYEEEALALCEKWTQAWIRSKGYEIVLIPDGTLYVEVPACTMQILHPISGQPDWLAAARWVYEQEKKQ